MVLVILVDVNVLVYAHRPDIRNHPNFRKWFEEALGSGEICGLSDLALAGMIRIITHPQIFPDPTPLDVALEFANRLREHPACILVSPGERHWEIFTRLCNAVGAKGNLVSDA